MRGRIPSLVSAAHEQANQDAVAATSNRRTLSSHNAIEEIDGIAE
jgi:hypothetical protein